MSIPWGRSPTRRPPDSTCREAGLSVPCAAILRRSSAAPAAPGLPATGTAGVNVSPTTNSTSYNYNWSTGTLTLGTAAATESATQNLLQNTVSDPTPPDPNGYGTFIGTARPVKSPTGGGAVLYEQSVCGSGYPTCFSDGTFTFGDMVMYTLRGATLDQLTNLHASYYVQAGCFGGGSPRFSISVSNATGKHNIHVYLGTPPGFADCPAGNTWFSTDNLAMDSAGLRWDTSQIPTCPFFYNTYSGAVACANAARYTINAIRVLEVVGRMTWGIPA